METNRIRLQAIDAAEARRIRDSSPGPRDRWAEGYPFDGDLRALGAFLRADAERGEQRPWGYYRIDRLADGLAIGGIGFAGPPDRGVVTVGYGLIEAARGHGYAAEALLQMLTLAADLGATGVRADTDPDNIASRRTLERAGFRQVGTRGELLDFEIELAAHPSR